jgi:methylated-DNA-[protein]-cysteine S-methyltransferase
MAHFYKVIDSPIGMLKLVANENRLAAILWEVEKDGRVRLGPMTEDPTRPILVKAARQLREYFSGQRKHFDLDLDFSGTDFQKKVWEALLGIPFGETRTYAELAEQLGNAKAARAVGAANGKNPIAIVTPCHRVIGKQGELTGFAGGLNAKQTLLSIEGQPELSMKKHSGHREQMPAPLTRNDLFTSES